MAEVMLSGGGLRRPAKILVSDQRHMLYVCNRKR